MKQNKLSELSDEKLLKKRDLLKGITIGFSIVVILILFFFIYIFLTKGFDNIPVASIVPVIALPTTFLPLLIILKQLNKEIKSRNLK